MANNQSPTAPHVLMIPYPSQGHMLPLLDLARLLSLRGVTVTIAITPKNLPLLSPLLSSSSSFIHPLSLPFPTHPSLPPNVENAKDLPPPIIPNLALLIQASSFLLPPLLQWAQSAPNPPTAIIADFFAGWANSLARRLSVPSLIFCAYGPFSLSLVHRLWLDSPPPSDSVSFTSVPGSPSLPWRHLSSMYTEYQRRKGEALWEFVRDCFLSNFTSASALLFDSLDALEGRYISHLRRALPHARVLAVGPLNQERRGGAANDPDSAASRLLTWLNGFAEGSVTYVSFGSQTALSAAQGAALAAGLERSGAPFVWRVREDEQVVVPEEFEERVKGRGMVVRGWAPQVEALRHAAVGAFLTHCGWNSVLEGIAAGVALLTWPMMADQFMNARLVEEEAGIGVRVCEGTDAVPDPDDLARVVVGMNEGVHRTEKMRAAEMRRKAAEAVQEGGSSYNDLSALVDALNGYASVPNGH